MEKLRNKLAEQNKRSFETIRELRERNFSNNLPFLLLSEALPEGQAYYELPNGNIEIREIISSNGVWETKFIQCLSAEDADEVKRAYGLL